MLRLGLLLAILLLVLTATGCGQTGPLTLPERDLPDTAPETAQANQADEEDDD